MPRTIPKKIKTPDQLLAYHLEQAESHLIDAVTLFSKVKKPDRHKDYLPRLERAQTLVTWLLREELVRKRGSLRRRAA